MKSLDDFNETVGRLTAAIDSVRHATDVMTLSKKESEAVHTLQLLEFLIGAIGQDLYQEVRARHTAIMRGDIKEQEESNEDNKRSDAGRTERQSNSKTKRTSRKRTSGRNSGNNGGNSEA